MYDRFNRRIHYLRLSVTDLCNLRCQYCMPAEGVQLLPHQDILTFEEMTDVVREAVDLGIDKVRLTGGEPLVRRGIIDLVRMIGQVPGIKDYAMTTNGSLLTEYARDLRAAGIQRLNISLDTVDPERYRQITRVGDLDRVLEGIEAARRVDFGQIKLNCVIQASSDEPDARQVAAFGKELYVIAAVVIGGASLAGGRGSVLGSLVGALFIQFLEQGLIHTRVEDHFQKMIVGAFLILAIALDRYRHARTEGG